MHLPRLPLVLPVAAALALGAGALGAAAAAADGPALTANGVTLQGATVGASTTVSVSAAGATTSVKWLLDGSYLGVDRTAPFSWPVTAATGPHQLKARAYDAAGRETRVSATYQVAASGATAPTTTAVVTVHDGAGLARALAAATPGVTVELADGTYTAGQQFTLATACTAAAPCRLHGSRAARLDGAGLSGHYGLHLQGASYWTVAGLTVTNASKGIVLDGSSHDTLDGVDVHQIGAEGIHLRAFSSDNTVRASIVHDTGRSSPAYGEGLYVGSAVSNWSTYSGGRPDASDRNVLTGNSVWATGAESVDIKEGTTGGTLSANSFDGAGMSGKNSADSWVDVKGNAWTVARNTGRHALLDGFQTHVLSPGWGSRNAFLGNTAQVDAAGYGFRLDHASTTANVVRCDNAVTGAALGVANQPCG